MLARDRVEGQLDEQQRKIRPLELKANQLRHKRDRAAQKHEKRLADVTVRRTRLHDDEQHQLVMLNQQHQDRMRPLLQEQQKLRQQEAAARQTVQHTFGPKLAALQHELGGLGQAEQDELAKRLRERQDQFVRTALGKFGVIDANMPALDRVQRMRLIVAGIVSAIDVDQRAAAVQGMEPARMATLLAWRQALEVNARLVAPKTLIPKEAEPIRKQFARRRQELEKQRIDLEAARRKQEQAVPAQFAQRLSALDAQLNTIRVRHDQSTSQVRARATDEVRALDDQLFDAQRGTLPKLQELDTELDALEHDVEMLREQRRQLQEQLDTIYGNVQFGTWVQWVLGFKRRP